MSGRFTVFVLDPIAAKGVARLKEGAAAVLWNDPRVGRWPEEADGVIVDTSRISAPDLARARAVRIIAKHGIGLDRIDLKAARARGIDVVNTAGVNAEACAQMTLGLALGLCRRIAEADQRLRAGERVAPKDFLGQDLLGKAVGIVGMGHIGRAAARKFQRAFEMRVLAYSPSLPPSAWAEIDVPVTRVERLDDLLPEVDLLSIHTPLSERTRHLIDGRALSLMKPSAMLINTARGGIVDETALFAALSGGRLWGAALDVFESEPPPRDHPLLSCPHFVATPHMAAYTVETMERTAETAAELVLEALNGNPPRNLRN
ncbi:MAG: hydroxyacid dehydrogenase [Proteobacteria bacterium]|nr:hydroxyacid dehydrogenase [Pseudomonadota bacterium]